MGALTAMTAWAWERLGTIAGRMRPDGAGPVSFVVPPLSGAAREYVVRIASFWADEVFTAEATGATHNLWTAPVVDLQAPAAPGSLGERLSEFGEGAASRRLFPQLGYGRARMVLETVAPGHASARLHSHSHVDEYYLVLAGRATLRMGGHRVPVETGSLVGKPTGPDLTSQIVADRGEPVTILDMEIWPEAGHRAKDLVHYPDFAEVFLRGAGWAATFGAEALRDTTDMGRHYDDGYRRGVDGTWTAADIPGAPARRDG